MLTGGLIDWRNRAFAIAVLALLSGCATFAPPPRTGPEPKAAAPAPWPAGSRPVALVLSGGAARAYAHVGVIKVLEANGIRPDIVVGASAGSLVGALYASGRSAREVEEGIGELHMANFNDIVFPGLGFLPGEKGFIRGAKLQQFIADRVRKPTIEEFPIRFAAVATDLAGGDPVAFTAGDPALAVRASMAVPGVIIPATIGGRMYTDGQVSSPLPVEIARKLGARVVVAVDVVYPPEDAFVYSVPSVVFQAFTIALQRLTWWERGQADLVIAPELPPTSGQLGIGDRDRLIAAGEAAAREALPAIRRLLAGAVR